MNTIQLENGVKLGESGVIEKLPNGVIDKKATGIGATTLEIKSERHSIIVCPTKSLAYNKAEKHKLEDNTIYVGSKVNAGDKEIGTTQIKHYINKSVSGNKHAKILVVANSLWKVLKAIKESKLNKNDFFLMIDEIDTYQIDSSYRNTLPEAIDTYFSFPDVNRCMISATMLPFSDPRINNEPKTEIKIINHRKKDLTLIGSVHFIPSIQILFNQIFEESHEDKVVIAYDNIDDVLMLHRCLENQGVAYANNIGLACSDNNESKAGELYTTIDNTGILKNQITFITSTYFNGIDIQDKFHLISVSNIMKPYTLLSEQKIIQITGRGRNGLLSNRMLFLFTNSELANRPNYTSTDSKKDELLRIANAHVGAYECAKKHYTGMGSDQASAILESLRNTMIKVDPTVEQVVRTTKDAKGLQVSYFHIDSALEKYRIDGMLYNTSMDVAKKLKEAFHVVEVVKLEYKDLMNEQPIIKEYLEEKKLKKSEEIKLAFKFIEHAEEKDLIEQSRLGTPITKDVIFKYRDVKEFFNNKKTALSFLRDNLDTKKFNNFMVALKFQAMKSNHPFKKEMNKRFKKGKLFTRTQLIDVFNEVLELPQIGIDPFEDGNSHKTAVTILRKLYHIKKIRKQEFRNEGVDYKFEIGKKNPLKLKHINKSALTDDKPNSRGFDPKPDAVNIPRRSIKIKFPITDKPIMVD
jgi:hypothetical protein